MQTDGQCAGRLTKVNQLLFCALLVLVATGCAERGVAQQRERLAEASVASSQSSTRLELAQEGVLPSLRSATEWINSPPLTLADLHGKVVLVDFWTYSCINWRRTLPYLRAWADKYRSRGLVVIGVHTPEFEFEKMSANVRWAVKDMAIDYPVAMDNDYAVWSAFSNHFWPALYFADAAGRIRHHQFGEGDYERSERVIQDLLREAGAQGITPDLVSVDPRGVEAGAAWDSVRSPETYVGYERAAGFASPGGAAADEPRVYSAPPHLTLNEWALSEDWTIRNWSAVSNQANSQLVYRFHARDLHLVMGSASGTTVRFRVLVDGKPPGVAHGIDVDADGIGALSKQRLYQLIRQPPPVLDRVFEIRFLDPSAEVFSFTFG